MLWQLVPVSAPRVERSHFSVNTVAVNTAASLPVRMDAVLGQVPGLSLFRRADSRTAHPTTQGLTMRGVGANAAGRVLVSHDGVPLNDPFGGWVYWSVLSPLDYPEAIVSRGGGPGRFGAQALAGSAELNSASLRNAGGVTAGYGTNETVQLNARHASAGDVISYAVSGGYFETDGAFLLAEEQRGSVDVRAASSSEYVTGQVRWGGEAFSADMHIRYFEEDRTNGLSLATNSTEGVDLSLVLSGDVGEASWELVSYYRDRQFQNAFASARDERTSERVVLDQFDVPAWGAGGLLRFIGDGWELGVDTRRMSGETNERFRNLGAGFTRQRRAGGDQLVMGLYGDYTAVVDGWRVASTLRMDRWRTFNGERRETNLSDDSLVRLDEIADQRDWIWSGQLSVERSLTGAIDMRIGTYKNWRLPTLNEYYRPFRVVNDITEANPDLVPEKLYGMEVGFDYKPTNTVSVSATVFRNWLRDGVGNITIGFGPGFFELGGFVPAGGVLRQRANIDQSITDGFEFDAAIALQTGWRLEARYLYARARVTRFDSRPELVGKRPAQTPRHTASFMASYDGSGALSGRMEMRIVSGQYDDDLNTRRLDAFVTLNAGASYALNSKISLQAAIENLFDSKVVSALSADGLETLAQRRFARAGLNISF